jgi:hypothetical protein
VIHRSRGRVGLCVLIQFSESSAMVTSRSIRKGGQWMPTYVESHMCRGSQSTSDTVNPQPLMDGMPDRSRQ